MLGGVQACRTCIRVTRTLRGCYPRKLLPWNLALTDRRVVVHAAAEQRRVGAVVTQMLARDRHTDRSQPRQEAALGP